MKPPAEPLPEPWLFKSEALIRELDRCRELENQIPTNGDCNATHFGIQVAVNAIWNLTENLRYLFYISTANQQRAIRRQHEQSLGTALEEVDQSAAQKIVHFHASAPSTGNALKK